MISVKEQKILDFLALFKDYYLVMLDDKKRANKSNQIRIGKKL